MVALGAALYRAPALVRADRAALKAPAFSLADSDIEGIRFFVLPHELKAARELIPPGATYTIVRGSSDSLAVPAVFQFWLMPRRLTTDLGKAQWVIAYHVPVSSIHVAHKPPVTTGDEDNVFEVRR